MLRNRVIKNIFSIRLSSTVSNSTTQSQNVNFADVDHHSKLSNDWWDTAGPMKGLHALNLLRVPFIRDGLIATGQIDSNKINKSNILEGLKILEIGCGGGILTKSLTNLKAHVTAIEPSETLIDTAKQNIKAQNVEFICDSIENFSIENNDKFDAVVASEVLEHVAGHQSFLTACVNTVKPGGSIFITTMNKTFVSWLFGVVAAEHVLDVVPKNTHDWNIFISPEDVKKILKDLNCSTLLVNGVKYEFWNNTCKWTRRTDINYVLHAIKNEN